MYLLTIYRRINPPGNLRIIPVERSAIDTGRTHTTLWIPNRTFNQQPMCIPFLCVNLSKQIACTILQYKQYFCIGGNITFIWTTNNGSLRFLFQKLYKYILYLPTIYYIHYLTNSIFL